MSANPNHPEDDALPSTSSDTRGLIDGGEGPSTRNKTVRQRSSIEADSDDEIHDDGARGGAHPFQAAPEYRVRRSTADAGADNGGHNNGDLVYSMEDWTFLKLTTVPWAVILMVVNGLVVVTVFLLPILCLPHNPDPNEEDKNVCPIEPFSILIYVHVIYWVLHLIGDQILKHDHKIIRLLGYTEFYLETKNVRRAPFYIVSVGNALILLTSTVLHDYCETHVCKSNKFADIDFLRGIITVECIAVAFMWLYYSRQVLAFNKAENRPDYMRVDLMREWLVDLGGVEEEEEEEKHLKTRVIRLLPEERDNIIEKHAELIRYMIAHTDKQNKKILELAMQPTYDEDRY